MAANIQDLIARFQHTERELAEAIASSSQSSQDAILKLDKMLVIQFDQLIEMELNDGNDLMKRIRFLTKRLEEIPGSGRMSDQISQKILTDVNTLVKVTEGNVSEKSPELGSVPNNAGLRSKSGDLFETSYTSSAITPFYMHELSELCGAAQAHNEQHDITGVLSFDQNTRKFMQILEGPKTQVESLMNSILQDSRHADITIRFQNPIETRCYGQWSMFLVAPNGNGAELNPTKGQ